MQQTIIYALSALAALPQALAAGPVCKQDPYGRFMPLQKEPAALQYCKSRYPIPCVTSTVTAKQKTATVEASTVKTITTVTSPTVVGTTTVEKTTATSATSVISDTTIVTSTVDTTISVSTEYTGTFTSTVDYTAPNDKRDAYAAPTPPLLKEFYEKGPSCKKTACSCIQTPDIKTITVYPSATSTVTKTKTISATQTDLKSITATSKVNVVDTITVGVTSTSVTPVTYTSTSVTSAIKTVESQCPSSKPKVCNYTPAGLSSSRLHLRRGASPIGPYCANLNTDRYNCGSCGNYCGDIATCQSGVCTANLPASKPPSTTTAICGKPGSIYSFYDPRTIVNTSFWTCYLNCQASSSCVRFSVEYDQAQAFDAFGSTPGTCQLYDSYSSYTARALVDGKSTKFVGEKACTRDDFSS